MTSLFSIGLCPHSRAGRLRRSGLSQLTAGCHRPVPPRWSLSLRPPQTRRARAPLPSGNYNSQQAGGGAGRGAARERTAVSSMATVLSRALKLPGKGCAPGDGPTAGRAGPRWAALGCAVPGWTEVAAAGAALMAGGAGAAAPGLRARCHSDVAMWRCGVRLGRAGGEGRPAGSVPGQRPREGRRGRGSVSGLGGRRVWQRGAWAAAL